MRYSGLIKNDITAAPGLCVTLFVSGCDLHCYGCHNPEAQSFEYGAIYTEGTAAEIIQALQANSIPRSLCIMGGEPLHQKNRETVWSLINEVKRTLPLTKIYIWTGYTYEQLDQERRQLPVITPLSNILNNIDYLIDGPYIHVQRDITLPMRGSRNQRIIDMKATNQEKKIVEVRL